MTPREYCCQFLIGAMLESRAVLATAVLCEHTCPECVGRNSRDAAVNLDSKTVRELA